MNAMTRNSLVTALAAAAVLALPAQAEPIGIYGGLQAGYSSTDTNEDAVELDNDKAIGIYGGYRFIDWLGAEAGYTRLGTFDVDSYLEHDADLDGGIEMESIHVALSLWGKFVGPLEVFAKVGAHYGVSKLEKKSDSASGDDDLKESSYSFYYAAGLEYPFTDMVSATVTYENYRDLDILKEDIDMGEAGVDVISLGVLLNF